MNGFSNLTDAGECGGGFKAAVFNGESTCEIFTGTYSYVDTGSSMPKAWKEKVKQKQPFKNLYDLMNGNGVTKSQWGKMCSMKPWYLNSKPGSYIRYDGCNRGGWVLCDKDMFGDEYLYKLFEPTGTPHFSTARTPKLWKINPDL